MSVPTPLFTNPYALPVVITGFVIVLLGIWVVGRERGSATGWLFLGMTATVGTYLVSAGTSYSAPSAADALVWVRAAHVGVGLMPSAFLWAVAGILGQIRRRLTLLTTVAMVGGFFAGLAIFSDGFVDGVVPLFWGFYPTYGGAGLAFIGFFAVVMIGILVGFAVELHRTTNPTSRKRLVGMIIAFGVGYIGSVDFLPVFGVEIYAFGYVPILAFVVIIAYVIVQYRLVDITPELAAPQILQTMESGVVVTDTGGVVRLANRAAGSLLKLAPDRLAGRTLDELLDLPDGWLPTQAPLEPIVDYEMELTSGDSSMALSISASPLIDKRNTLLGRVFVAHDVTDRKAAEAELRSQALFDSLTGLPNRVLFFDRLKQLLELAKRNKFTLAILYMDLDKFKEVNDSLGHEAGDILLKQAATRMLDVTRASDTIARMGGDEFIGVCGRITSPADAEVVAQKLVDALGEPFVIDQHTISIGVSVGISIYPDQANDSQTLLAKADRAMYAVKSRRGSGFRVFGEEGE